MWPTTSVHAVPNRSGPSPFWADAPLSNDGPVTRPKTRPRSRFLQVNASCTDLGCLHEAERQVDALLRQAADLVLVFDDTGAVVFATPSVEGFTGRRLTELPPLDLRWFVHPLHRHTVAGTFAAARCTPGRPVTANVVGRRADGTWRHFEMVVTHLPHRADTGATVCNLRDVTDPLTDVAGRAMLAEWLADLATRPGTPPIAALVLVDVDGLSGINELAGSGGGDEVLRQVAQRLAGAVGDDDLIARVGGDEFAVLVHATPPDEPLTAFADRLSGVLHAPYRLTDGGQLAITLGIGVVPGHDEVAPAELWHEAEVALQHAKDGGRGQVVISDAALRRRARRRLRIELGLYDAIHACGHLGQGLRLAYQPIVDLRDGRTVAVEALARWTDPDLGEVPPAEFIPIAEATGLIVPMGRCVLETACEQLAAWTRATGDDALCVSVNLSTRQFADAELVPLVAETLAAADLDPRRLWLEITETALMEDVDAALRTVQALKRLGVAIHIDDFGTGYSSLAYLRRLPVDGLKIDRTFVRELDVTRKGHGIVAAVTAMARALDLHVIAEGVETPTHLAWLRELGCELGQGYHWSRPLPATAVTEWLRGGRAGRCAADGPPASGGHRAVPAGDCRTSSPASASSAPSTRR